jgi:ribosomal protein S18 acetylase RimI-like enzyme
MSQLNDHRARFASRPYDLGLTTDGRTLVLQPIAPDRASLLADEIVTFGPWVPAHYAIDAHALAEALVVTGDGAVRYEIAVGGEPAGVVIVRVPWLGGPYLQLLAVLPAAQGQGIGARVLGWLEAEARGIYPNVWLCVSDFNVRAQSFYRRHGYEKQTTIEALLKPDIDEILMRKRL